MEILEHVVFSSKIATNASMKFMVGTSSGHGVPRIFSLCEASKEFPLETLN